MGGQRLLFQLLFMGHPRGFPSAAPQHKEGSVWRGATEELLASLGGRREKGRGFGVMGDLQGTIIAPGTRTEHQSSPANIHCCLRCCLLFWCFPHMFGVMGNDTGCCSSPQIVSHIQRIPARQLEPPLGSSRRRALHRAETRLLLLGFVSAQKLINVTRGFFSPPPSV